MDELHRILGAANLTGLIQGVSNGLPQDALPPALMTQTRGVEGDTGTYLKVDGTRKTARMAAFGSPSERRNLSGVSTVPVKLIHTVENIQHSAATLLNLMSESGARQRLGSETVGSEVKEFAQLFVNLRQAAVFSAFALGAIHFDVNGNLLPSSSSAKVTVDFQIPAGNQDQLDVFGDGDIISATWATAGTDIVKQIKKLKAASLKKTGYALKNAFYGENVLDYFLTNTKLKELINRNQAFQVAAAAGEIPNGFLGFNWWPAYQGFFEDADGVAQSIFPADQVVFLPDVDTTWYDLIGGSYPVPQNLGLGATALEVLSNLAPVTGMFSYAEVTTDPPSIKQVAGDTFLPVIKVPGAVFIANVTP